MSIWAFKLLLSRINSQILAGWNWVIGKAITHLDPAKFQSPEHAWLQWLWNLYTYVQHLSFNVREYKHLCYKPERTWVSLCPQRNTSDIIDSSLGSLKALSNIRQTYKKHNPKSKIHIKSENIPIKKYMREQSRASVLKSSNFGSFMAIHQSVFNSKCFSSFALTIYSRI